MGGNKGWEKIRLNKTSHPKNISKVLVLQGGISEEKEVSNATADSCIEALKEIKLDVEAVSINSTNIYKLAEVIKNKNPDVIFNALHGGIGEDGTIQGFFETLKIFLQTSMLERFLFEPILYNSPILPFLKTLNRASQ